MTDLQWMITFALRNAHNAAMRNLAAKLPFAAYVDHRSIIPVKAKIFLTTVGILTIGKYTTIQEMQDSVKHVGSQPLSLSSNILSHSMNSRVTPSVVF